jgi:hypothetical protein
MRLRAAHPCNASSKNVSSGISDAVVALNWAAQADGYESSGNNAMLLLERYD